MPDPVWGPAPEDWDFWPESSVSPCSAEDGRKISIPLVRGDLFVGTKFKNADNVLVAMRDALVDGEHVTAIVAINGLRPMLDVLVVTNARVIAATRHGIPDDLKIVVPAHQVGSVEIGEGMKAGRITLIKVDGESVGLGTVMQKADIPAVEYFVAALATTPPPESVTHALQEAAARPNRSARAPKQAPEQPSLPAWVPPSSTAPFVGTKFKNADNVLVAMRDALVDGEHVTAIVAINGLRPMLDVLVVTNARVIAATRRGIPDDLKIVVPAHQVGSVEIGEGMKAGRITLIKVDGESVGLGTVMQKADIPAVEYFVAALATTPPPESVTYALQEAAARPNRSARAPKQVPERQSAETPAEKDAARMGFPLAAIGLVELILAELDKAVIAAESGDIVDEERHLMSASKFGDRAGFGNKRKVRSWTMNRIQEREQKGRLRRGSRLVTEVGKLIVRSDRILYKDTCYLMDSQVGAAVEIDGQVLESTRPTLTRMAVGSVLPGPALNTGLALAKTTTKDFREANFFVVHPEWRIVVNILPSEVPEFRPIAAQINAIAASLDRGLVETQPPPDSVSNHEDKGPSSGSVGDLALSERMDQLERISAMKDRGVITEEEAERLRREVLGSS